MTNALIKRTAPAHRLRATGHSALGKDESLIILYNPWGSPYRDDYARISSLQVSTEEGTMTPNLKLGDRETIDPA